MTSEIARLLSALYGDQAAIRLVPRLESMFRRWRETASNLAHTSASPLSQRDALLITYADQIAELGVAPLKTLGRFADRHLREVVSGLHILPFYPSSSDDGFSVIDYFKVDPAFGTWDDLRDIGKRFDLMFDGVFNHLSAKSEWFTGFLAGAVEYRDFFVTVEGAPDLSAVIRPRALPLLTEFPTLTGPEKVWTTFSADQVDLNFQNPEVLFSVSEALWFYVNTGARFVRLDAIAFLWKEIGTTCLHLRQTHQIIQLFRAVLDEVAAGVRLITETNVPHTDNVSYFGDGTNEAHLVYNFALPPLVLHSFATGNASRLTAWARGLEVPSDQVAFFNFLASHDGIGINPVRGILSEAEIDALVDRTEAHGGFISYKHLPDGSKTPYELNINFFDALSNPADDEPLEIQIDRSLCAHAILLSLAGVPGIYFHSLFGSRGDRAGAVASNIPRRINREKLRAGTLERELADPKHLRSQVFRRFQALLRDRAENPAFAPSAKQQVRDFGEQIFAVERTDDRNGRSMLCIHNVSDRTLEVPIPGASRATTLMPYEFRRIDRSPHQPSFP